MDPLVAVLSLWASRQRRPLFVARSLALRWVQSRPAIGIDPDVCVLDPPPADVRTLRSLCLWKPGRIVPTVSFEVVRHAHPYKDYVGVHDRYAALGARELVVFDPMLVGPRSLGGPFALQVWRRDDIGVFGRQYAGPGPVFSEPLGAWLLADREAGLLRLADDRAGVARWPTAEEFERSEKERERSEKERERAARLDVERRLAALEESVRSRS